MFAMFCKQVGTGTEASGTPNGEDLDAEFLLEDCAPIKPGRKRSASSASGWALSRCLPATGLCSPAVVTMLTVAFWENL